MRRDQNVGCGPKRVILGQWLWIGHIQCCAADLLGFQCGNQCFLVDDLATCDVGDVGPARVAFVQEFELVCGEQVCGVFGQRHANDQQVDLLLQEVVKIFLGRSTVPCTGYAAIWVARPGDDIPVILFALWGLART